MTAFDDGEFGLFLTALGTEDNKLKILAHNLAVPCDCEGDQSSALDDLLVVHTFLPETGNIHCQKKCCAGVDIGKWRNACVTHLHNNDKQSASHVVNFTASLMDGGDAFKELVDSADAVWDEEFCIRASNPLLELDDFTQAPTIKLQGYGKRTAGPSALDMYPERKRPRPVLSSSA